MSLYIDTHCHLDLFPDPFKALDDAPHTVVVTGYRTAEPIPAAGGSLSRRPPRTRRTGPTPTRAATASALEVNQLIRQLAQTDYVGEVGLDFSGMAGIPKKPSCASSTGCSAQPAIRYKVVTVHSRGAEAVVIERLRSAGVVAILHWYTGPLGLMQTRCCRSVLQHQPGDAPNRERPGTHSGTAPRSGPHRKRRPVREGTWSSGRAS